MTRTATLRPKGQVTIPAQVRRRAGLEDGAVLEFEIVERGVLIRPVLIVDDVDVDEEFARMVISTTEAGFEELRADSDAWRSEQRERQVLDGSLEDGLDPA
jgi:AbrB family looped-hinge helix DNA binding protein